MGVVAMEIMESESIFLPTSPRNLTKALALSALHMYSVLGLPWTTSGDLRASLDLPRSLLTLLQRWQSWGYIDRAGASGYFEYRIAQKGKDWLRDLVVWWPEIKHRIPVAEDERLAAVDGVRRHVAALSRITIWWGSYSGGVAWNIHSIKGPFLAGSDYQYHRQRVDMDELQSLFDTDYLAETSDAMGALAFISDKLDMPPGRAMIEAMVAGGQLEWQD